MKAIRLFLALLLGISVSVIQVVSAQSATGNRQQVRVAFIGVHFKNIPEEVQSDIVKQMRFLLQKEQSLQLISRRELEQILGPDYQPLSPGGIDDTALRELASQLKADFIFAGHLENEGEAEGELRLSGDIYRYDRNIDHRYKLRVQAYYEDFPAELQRFEQQLVQSAAPPARDKKFDKWPLVIIGAATVAAIIAFFRGTKEGQGNSGPVDQTPAFH